MASRQRESSLLPAAPVDYVLSAQHRNRTSEKQYKTQLKKWSLDTKYIKASEYITMIKIKREREREDPPRQTQFVLRGRAVDPRDITRFEKRAIKKGNPIPDDNEYDQGLFYSLFHIVASLTAATEALEELTYDDPPPEGTEYACELKRPAVCHPKNIG
jgi:hypothetical protein